jgi:hypothetical protein
VFLQHRPDKSGHRMLRLADREIDGGLAGVTPASRSVRRTKGERASAADAVEIGDSRSAAGMYIT